MQNERDPMPDWRLRASEKLIEISGKLSAMVEREAVIDLVCGAARDISSADGACFILREGEMVHYSREDAVAPLWAGQRFPITNCISGWSILHRVPVVIEDIYSDDRIPIEYYQNTFVKSLAMMPVNHNNPIGAIGLYWATRRRATDQELELLESLAELVRIALVNADLFEEARNAQQDAEHRAEEMQKQADLIDQSYDALLVWELGGKITFWNRAAESLYGFSKEEAIGRSSHELLRTTHPTTVREFEDRLRQAGSWEGELQHTTKDGRRLTVESRCKAAELNGRFVALESNRDVTERRKAERARKMLAAIVETSDDAIFSKTLDGIITSWNKGAENLYGYEADEAIGKHVSMLMPEERADDFPQLMERLERGEGIFHYETIRAAKDGRKIVVSLTISPIFDDAGNMIQASTIARDITRRKRDEETIRSLMRASERLNSTLDIDLLLELLVEEAVRLANAESGMSGLSSPAGMSARRYFQRGAWLRVENSWASGSGLPGWLLQHKTSYLTNDAATDENVSRDLVEQFEVSSALSTPVLGAQGETLGFFEVHNKKDGRGFTLLDQELLLAVSQVAAIAIANALAFQKIQRAEEENARLLVQEQDMRSRAEKANRLKDEFLATISHELRTPLNAIVGWAGMLRAGKVDAETITHALGVIDRNAKAQNKLIDDLLDVSRIITGKLRLNVQPVELSAIVHAALDAISPAADAKAIRVQLLLDPNAGPVSGDPDRLQQVIWNLLSNAVKFTPRGGRVQVRLQRADSHVEIAVSDTGQGINADFLPFVFDRFRQSDSTLSRPHGGLGLGLAIVRHLVEQHGGTVSAHSPGEGKGATFTINLPVMIAHDTGRIADDLSWNQLGSDTSMPFDCPQSLEGLRLMVVDDDPDSRELLQFVLERCKSEIRSSASAKDALAEMVFWKPDILISDIEMPDESGYFLIQKIRESDAQRGERLPAVALTAHARIEDRMRALSAGFDAHIAKPVEPAELVAVIASLARRAQKA